MAAQSLYHQEEKSTSQVNQSPFIRLIRRHKMQKLSKRNTYTPTNASQVCSNCDSLLNNSQRVVNSVTSLKTLDNNSEVNLYSGKNKQNLRVFVINMRKEPLMPTKPQKAMKLLKAGKAKVVQRCPFTIQLLYPTGEAKQEITLGVDPGYKFIGFSATTDKEELICGEFELRWNMSKNIEAKAMYRNHRRSRLWYRKPRFLNRKKSKGWLAPSIQHKLDSHIKLIDKISDILPLTNIIIEVGTFDTQKIINPEISGVEYQQGELSGYNLKEYLLQKYNYKCIYCNKSNVPLEIDHFIPKSKGGSDRVTNLVIACHDCNQAKSNLMPEEFITKIKAKNIITKIEKPLKQTAFMNILYKRIVTLINSRQTYGYITKHNRIKEELNKSHINDAFIIANGTKEIKRSTTQYKVTQRRRNNRKLQINRKGYKPSIRRQHYTNQPGDLIKYEGKIYESKGVSGYGRYIQLNDENNKIISIRTDKIKVIKYGKGLQFQNFKTFKPKPLYTINTNIVLYRGE